MKKVVWAVVLLTWLAGIAEAAETITVAEARRMALAHNHDIKDLQENILRAEIAIQKAWATLLPEIAVTGTVTRNNKAVSIPTGTGENRTIQELWNQSVGIGGDMILFSPSSIPLIMNAHENADAVGTQSRHIEAELLHGVTSAYYAAAQAGKLVRVAEQALSRSHEQVKHAQARFNVGQGIRLDVVRAELEVAKSEKTLRESENARDQALQALGFLIGKSDGAFAVTPPEEDPKIPTGSVDQLIKDALGKRFDLKATRMNDEIARRAELQAYLSFLPVFSLQSSYDWNSAGGFSGENTSWNVMFIGRWPLFDRSLTIAQVRENRSLARTAANAQSRLAEQIDNGIRQEYLKLTQAETSLVAAKKEAELAQQTYDMVAQQFAVGLVDNLAMIDASTALVQVEQELAQQELALKLAILSLRHASGLYLTVE
ncbi:MAG: TolC family protein [Myxococcales bacterium]|nr:MAG: TolC family protein [Myxococcales bacterium]